MISPHRIVGALALALWCGVGAPAAWADGKEAKGSSIRGVEVFANWLDEQCPNRLTLNAVRI